MPEKALDHLAAALESATGALDADRQALAAERKAANRRSFIALVVGIVGVVVGVLGIVAGLSGLHAADQSQHAVDLVNSQRATSRVVACKSDNDTAARINGLNDSSQAMLRAAIAPTLTNPARTEEQRAQAQQFLDDQLAEFQKVKVAERDCSPKAIDDFYSGTTSTTR